MNRTRLSCCVAIFIFGTLALNTFVYAVEFKPDASLGVEFTDNSKKASTNEEDDTIIIARLGAVIDASSGSVNIKGGGSIRHQEYLNDTFGSQDYLNLNATAGWEMIKDRVSWRMQDVFSQQAINSLNANTPDNTQDTNVFTFGPTLFYPVSSRQSFRLVPEYRKFNYESGNIDNASNSVDANWNYFVFRTLSLGLRGGINKVDYDEELISDNTFTNLHFTLSGTRPRSTYSIELGSTHVEKEQGQSERGATGNMSWLYNITNFSHVRAYVSSDLTDTNRSLLNSGIDPDNAAIANEQITSEVLRNSVFRLSFVRKNSLLTSKAWLALSKQDYEFSLLDREVQAVGIDINRPVSTIVAAGVRVKFDKIDSTDINQIDDRYSVSGNLTYRWTRKFRTQLKLSYEEKDSSDDAQDYSESRLLVNFVYSGS